MQGEHITMRQEIKTKSLDPNNLLDGVSDLRVFPGNLKKTISLRNMIDIL